MSYVLCLVSDVWCHVSYLRPLMCDMYDIWSETVDIFVRCQMSNVKGLMSYVDVSDDWCQTSVVWCQASDVWGQISGVRRLISDVWCHMSDVICQTSHVIYVWCLMSRLMCDICISDVRRLMFDMCDVRCQKTDFMTYNRHLISDVWCIMSHVMCLKTNMSGVWCLRYVWCLMSRVLCQTSNVWYVWYLKWDADLIRQMSDIWCQTSDV